MRYTITVLKPFTEGRSGKSYLPGEVVTDPAWHAPEDEGRRMKAYAARGIVKIEELSADEPVAEAPRRTRRKDE